MPNLLSAEFLAELGDVIHQPLDFDMCPGEENVFVKAQIIDAARAFHDLAPLLRELVEKRENETAALKHYNKACEGNSLSAMDSAKRDWFEAKDEFEKTAANIAAQIKRKVGG